MPASAILIKRMGHFRLRYREAIRLLSGLRWALLLLGVLIAPPASAQRCPVVAFGEPGDVTTQCNDDGTASVKIQAEITNVNGDSLVNVTIEC